MKIRHIIKGFLLGAGLLGASVAGAATTPIPAAQFDSTGFIQKAELDTTDLICTPAARNNEPRLRGGWITVNGKKMIVPCNTILQMPATSLTWADLFDPTKSAAVNEPVTPITAGQTGLALFDLPKVFPSFEVRVVGNILTAPVAGVQTNVVGLIVPVSQQGLNIGTGLINAIDPATGFFRVGGILNDPGCANITGAACTGALVKINDPIGRFGAPHSPDPRFTADTDNPTIRTKTGWPVCIGPTSFGDTCAASQRPLNGDLNFPVDPFIAAGKPLRTFTIPAAAVPGTTLPIVTNMMPLMVGDSVDYSGTLVKINPALGQQGPGSTYISAHTLIADLGFYTPPNTAPAYVGVDFIELGVGGSLTAGIAGEVSARIKAEGFISDASASVNNDLGSIIDLFAVDKNPCTGVETERYLGTPFPGSRVALGAYRLQLNGPILTGTNKLIPTAASFLPPTREMIAKYTPGPHSLAGGPGTAATQLLSNGLTAGQYKLPNFDFVFPEAIVIGAPQVSANFESFPFLALGSGPLGGGSTARVGQLSPWPGDVIPAAAVCTATGFMPIVTAAPATILAASGATVALQATVTADPNGTGLNVVWTQVAGTPTVTLTPVGQSATFVAPVVVAPTTLTFKVTATDSIGAGTAIVTVIVNPSVITGNPGVSILTPAKWLGGTTGGAKGGKANISAFATNVPVGVIPTLTVTEVVDSSVPGAPPGNPTVGLGGMSEAQCIPVIAGVSCLVEVGVVQPLSYTVSSSAGGSQTVHCTPDPKKVGSLSCI